MNDFTVRIEDRDGSIHFYGTVYDFEFTDKYFNLKYGFDRNVEHQLDHVEEILIKINR